MSPPRSPQFCFESGWTESPKVRIFPVSGWFSDSVSGVAVVSPKKLPKRWRSGWQTVPSKLLKSVVDVDRPRCGLAGPVSRGTERAAAIYTWMA